MNIKENYEITKNALDKFVETNHKLKTYPVKSSNELRELYELVTITLGKIGELSACLVENCNKIETLIDKGE